MMGKVLADISVAVPYMVGGGAVASVHPDDTAITPAWRTSISDLTVLLPSPFTSLTRLHPLLAVPIRV
ncbi:hypothetical protein NEOLEDRAFT_1136745 [Neolentinus lepideus HHB14362 ss-1]|uniref:Uncharacterized protein n=1 Tax=Neolentinus lepideus HHB14362 ss-1 TaxID=1314782 RepID=A0A165R684_9AGAM|nr:hypothetical protein NEOLEDRAFT_1136745 [Neolentinus lepideus HHB14362 ss-1]